MSLLLAVLIVIAAAYPLAHVLALMANVWRKP